MPVAGCVTPVVHVPGINEGLSGAVTVGFSPASAFTLPRTGTETELSSTEEAGAFAIGSVCISHEHFRNASKYAVKYLRSVYLQRFNSNPLPERDLLQGSTCLHIAIRGSSTIQSISSTSSTYVGFSTRTASQISPICRFRRTPRCSSFGVNLRRDFWLITGVRSRRDGDNDHRRQVRYANADFEGGIPLLRELLTVVVTTQPPTIVADYGHRADFFRRDRLA
eukprot:IDg4587t1